MNDIRQDLTDTNATAAVITTAEFRTHARIYHSQDDSYISTLIVAATQVIEAETRRALINREMTLTLESFPASGEIVLPRSPLSNVFYVSYINQNDDFEIFNPAKYVLYSVNGVGRVKLKTTESWPTTLATGGMDVLVSFSAGYGATSASVPAALRHAVLLQATHMYESRTAVAPAQLYEIPRAVERLIVQYHTGDYQ
jgi:uncharacterized phiE125 gp8 family phage protein